MSAKLGKVIRVNVREAWKNEASHFTPWLASEQGLELLQDALEMDLEVEATEQFIGPFKADIVARRTDTPDEHWVLIENQLEKTDHRHLGQLLTYAAGLKAAPSSSTGWRSSCGGSTIPRPRRCSMSSHSRTNGRAR